MNKSTTKIFSLCICILISLSFAGCSKKVKESEVIPQPVSHEVLSVSTLLATIDPAHDIGEEVKIVFSERGHGVAYREKINGNYRVLHNGRPGRLYPVISLFNISPDGSHVAHDILVDGKRRMVIDGGEGKPYDDVWEPVFSPDGRHVAYTALIGNDKHYMVVDNNVSEPSYFYGNAVFNSDSTKIAYIDHAHGKRNARLIVSDLKFKKQSIKECRDDGMVINSERTMIAVVRIIGDKQRVISFSFSEPDIVYEGPLFDSIVDIKYINNIVFSSDGSSLMYTATKGGKQYIILNGIEEELPEGVLTWPPIFRQNGKGAGMILVTKEGGIFHEAFIKNDIKNKRYDEAAMPASSADGSQYAYCARKGKSIFIVVNGKEGPAFDHVVSPIFSPDGKFLVFRARKDGKRFIVVADSDGRVIRQHPGYDVVFEAVFTSDGKSVAYGVKDGNELWWKVEPLSSQAGSVK